MRIEMIAAGSMFALASATASASVINSWINWDAPSGYGSSNGSPGYDYATELLGTIAMPDTSTVYVKLTGEIAQSTTGSGWSRFGETGTDYWSGSSFTSDNVTSTPTNDRIGLAGYAVTTQTLSFYSDSGRTTAANIENIVLLLKSLGSPSDAGAFDFTQDFDILSSNSNLSRTNPSGGTYRLTGNEGDGAIQFLGSFSSFSWTVNNPELVAYWNLGATSAPPPSDSSNAVPGVGGIAAIAGLGLVGRRRRR